MNNKIDLVVTWVDSSDKNWRQDYNYWSDIEIKTGIQDKSNRQAFGEERTRDWGLFPFWFRCVEKNCPWVNNVFVICQRSSQVPTWLNREHTKLKIIYHDEFIPKELLPTFSIFTIQMFLWNIKELSNNFILCDDDFYFLKPIPEDLFFINNTPVDSWKTKDFNDRPLKTVFDQVMLNTDNFIKKHSQEKIYRYEYSHLPTARRKDIEAKIYDNHSSEILASLIESKFRSKKNLCNLIYTGIMKANNQVIQKDIFKTSQCIHVNIQSETTLTELLNKSQIACVNDTEFIKDFNNEQSYVYNWFYAHFSEKSSFEIYNSCKQPEIKQEQKPTVNHKNNENKAKIESNSNYYLYF